jgi:hypothetical protein
MVKLLDYKNLKKVSVVCMPPAIIIRAEDGQQWQINEEHPSASSVHQLTGIPVEDQIQLSSDTADVLFVYDRRLFLADATLPFGPIQVSFQR